MRTQGDYASHTVLAHDQTPHVVDVYVSAIFYFNSTAPNQIYTLSLHDALPILVGPGAYCSRSVIIFSLSSFMLVLIDPRSEEHTSELQSRRDLVCRLLLEKKNHY